MFCPRCGRKNDAGARFCQECGSALHKIPDVPVVNQTIERTSAVEYAGFWRRLAAFLIDYIVVIVIMAIAYFVLAVAGLEGNESATAIVTYVVLWLYWAGMESSSGQATLGKRALGILVTDLEGRRISFLRATGRNLAKYISAMTLLEKAGSS